MRWDRIRLLGGVLLLCLLAGCGALGGVTSDAGLAENATYDWTAETDVSINITGDEFTAVYAIENRSEIDMYHSTRYGIDQPMRIRAIQFRHPNGSIVNASAFNVSESRSRVTVEFPNDQGQFAFTSSTRTKRFSLPVLIPGSYGVTLPADHRVDNFILGTVRPGGHESTPVGDRVRLHWEELTDGTIRVHYYLARDVYLFVGIVVLGGIGAAIAAGYVWLQIKELRARRREMGLDLDVDEDDEFDQGPPPGMR